MKESEGFYNTNKNFLALVFIKIIPAELGRIMCFFNSKTSERKPSEFNKIT